MAHLGAKVSALLDGRLPKAEEERCWSHVHLCPPCRDMVEREGWVKTRLAGLSAGDAGASHSLKASIMSASALEGVSIFASDHLGEPRRTWSRGMISVGGGALGAAVIGVVALSANVAPAGTRPPAAEISEAGPSATTTGAPAPRTVRATAPASALTPIGVVELVVALASATATPPADSAGRSGGSRVRETMAR
jgi:hypothetical protein